MDKVPHISSSEETAKYWKISGSTTAKEKGKWVQHPLVIDQNEVKRINTGIIGVGDNQVTFKQNKDDNSTFLYFKNKKIDIKKKSIITFIMENQDITTNQKPDYFVAVSVDNGAASDSKKGYGEEVKALMVSKGNNKYEVTINIEPDRLYYQKAYEEHPKDFGIGYLKIRINGKYPGAITVKGFDIVQQ